MNNEELKSWFLDKLNNCYPLIIDIYPDDTFLCYDESYVRKMKLAKIANTVVKPPTKFTGKCLFRIETYTNVLWCDHSEIWIVFEEYGIRYSEIQKFIDDILLETEKYKNYHSVRQLRTYNS